MAPGRAHRLSQAVRRRSFCWSGWERTVDLVARRLPVSADWEDLAKKATLPLLAKRKKLKDSFILLGVRGCQYFVKTVLFFELVIVYNFGCSSDSWEMLAMVNAAFCYCCWRFWLLRF